MRDHETTSPMHRAELLRLLATTESTEQQPITARMPAVTLANLLEPEPPPPPPLPSPAFSVTFRHPSATEELHAPPANTDAVPDDIDPEVSVAIGRVTSHAMNAIIDAAIDAAIDEAMAAAADAAVGTATGRTPAGLATPATPASGEPARPTRMTRARRTTSMRALTRPTSALTRAAPATTTTTARRSAARRARPADAQTPVRGSTLLFALFLSFAAGVALMALIA